MPEHLLPALLATALLAQALLSRRRLRALEQAAAEARRLAENRARHLGLLAHDIQRAGLALSGPAAAIDPAAEARRLLRLADEVGEALAVGAGPRHLAPVAVPLVPLIEEAVAAAATQLAPGVREWRLAPEFAGLTLQVDRRALHGALVPVLLRAARMTREGDPIELRPVLTPDSVAIVVEDEGAGLPAEDLAPGAILAPDGTRGVGFGLSVARSLVEAHGGALRLEALPGIGARAWLSLPKHRLVAA